MNREQKAYSAGYFDCVSDLAVSTKSLMISDHLTEIDGFKILALLEAVADHGIKSVERLQFEESFK